MAEYKGELFDVPPAEKENASSSGWETKQEKNSAWNTEQPPMGAAIAMDSSTSASPSFGKKVDEVVKKREEKKNQEEQAAPLIPEFAQNPLMLAGAGAAGGAAVLGWKTLRDKMNNSAPAAGVERREPTMFGAQRLDEPTWSASTARTSPLSQEEMMNRLRGLADETSAVNEPAFGTAAAPSRNLSLEEAQARMAGITPAAAPAAPAAPVVAPVEPVAAPVASLEPVATPLASTAVTPARPVTPTPPAALASTVAPVAPPTGKLKTGAGLPAYAGEGKQYQRMPKEFPSVKEVPAGYAFVPGVGPGTNTIRNLETPEGYRAAVQLHGGPFGSHDEAVDFMNKYNAEQRMGPPADRTLRKSLGLPLQENTKGIPMKVAKVGGVVGAIMAIPDLANAAQNRDVGQAAQVGASFLPPAIQALTYAKGAGEGEDTELARQRRMQQYATNAGRGVAQGYDPRRLIGVAPPAR
jgi:hypothetical protein